MGEPKRAVAEIPQARFRGARWTVAMCEKEWSIFRSVMPDARRRMTVILQEFCEIGGDDMPGGAFRWLTPDPSDHRDVVRGSFEARGVSLHGRRAPDGQDRSTFFVTEILIDAPAPAPRGGARRTAADERQGRLQLDNRNA